MSIRNKLGLFISVAVALMLVTSGCASKEKTDEEKIKELFSSLADQKDAADTDKPPTVESQLRQINSFITASVWNEAFVNIGWYAKSGTDSTGQQLDMEFTIERLGQAMEKKAEYDAYIQGLDAEYDSVKQVWSKLSNETDNLYRQLKENPPQANDGSYVFETGLFKQYSQAFADDIRALTQK
ncbi:hypothetical protein EBB07_12235 [Paenibacillaceae bacterium]|nr:hypothetical protein EBB07_12235 [Paenibacillaceae bacterium]